MSKRTLGSFMSEFERINRLPPYVFGIVNELKMSERRRGKDIIDFGMGNPDHPPPKPIIDKLVEAAQRPDTHRYSVSRGIPRLRVAISRWYESRFGVSIDPDSEAVVTLGSKEGLAHLALAMVGSGDVVLVPTPTYPIHPYGFIIAGAQVCYVPMQDEEGFLQRLDEIYRAAWPKPKVLVLNFPANPTTHCVELGFFEEVVEFAKKYDLYVIHDIAYAEIYFSDLKPPSILQARGGKDVAVESYSLSKTYNMPGWRVGFVCGNQKLVGALTKIKSYLDYGMFTPIQVASIFALEGDQGGVAEVRDRYRKRRDVLCQGLAKIGWEVKKPDATMFVWAKIPDHYRQMGSLEFAKKLLLDARVAVSPGIGFGELGDSHVRFALIENQHRTRQAIRGIKEMLRKDGVIDEGADAVEAD